ncbi:MAG: aminotransferase class I/II-fold pyridoxal phosphate-dependent enzyme, partial [Candidatus Contubernalis sp.]|nr:aminotransferase class I/II-fold pyridoxal phosphate-dependent enzyme [Candidatus Contubernalis sp.]
MEDYRSFHVPGHQGGKGMDGPLKLLLKQPFKADLTEIPGLDNLHAPRSIIREALEIAAEAFGASETYFLVNGSTAGLMAMVNTVCRPGEKIILPRRTHQGVFGGIITSGADPVFIEEDSRGNRWEFTNVTSSQVKQALDNCPEARAVLVNNPTYFGVCADLKEIRKITAKRGVLLLVDEAHGGHLSFHGGLPTGASEAGADLWVQSTHKTLGSLTQSSMLHVGGERIDRERLRDMLSMFQSTSPSYLLLASLDAARRQMALKGKELLDIVISLAEEARRSLKQLDFELIPKQQGEFSLDITKLAFFTDRFEESGKKAAYILRRSGKIQVEMSGREYILVLLTLGHDDKDLASLVN